MFTAHPGGDTVLPGRPSIRGGVDPAPRSPQTPGARGKGQGQILQVMGQLEQ